MINVAFYLFASGRGGAISILQNKAPLVVQTTNWMMVLCRRSGRLFSIKESGIPQPLLPPLPYRTYRRAAVAVLSRRRHHCRRRAAS